jgi:hypothetical protein
MPNKLALGHLVTTAIIAFATPILAQGLQEPLSEETLREFFVFADDASLKYVDCNENHFPTCTYVWGAPHSKDSARIQLGFKPEGNTLMTVLAQAGSLAHFDRVEASYTDAQTVDSVGVKAVWSPKRHQLSLIRDDFLIMHVNIVDASNPNPKDVAIMIAEVLLARE